MDNASSTNAEFWQMTFEDLAELVLRNEQFSMRPIAMQVLADRAQAESENLSILANALEDLDPSTRRRAARTLAFCGQSARSLLPLVCQLLRSDTIWTVREAAASAIKHICWPAPALDSSDEIPLQLVESVLLDRESLVREACVHALKACLKDPSMAESVTATIWRRLEGGMQHPHASRRCRAVSALCDLMNQDPTVVARCIAQGLRDSHWKVRRTTVQRLADRPNLVFSQSGRRFILPELIKRRFDQNGIVQKATIETVQKLQASCQSRKVEMVLKGLTVHPSPFSALSFVLHQFELSETGETELRQICQRRLKWQADTL
ncbi:MAG: HEAT repeat domain-containing protein, partial [Planctomycetaceae bacterium]|nr:HEAT repeat domain-containing protein [Planctomycetaceae bacterium]